MEDIYSYSDAMILERIGKKLKAERLRQNITQQSLASAADISLSSVKKIENGDICSFDSFLRILRTLGSLDSLDSLIQDRQPSPLEYIALKNGVVKHERKKATGSVRIKVKEESEW